MKKLHYRILSFAFVILASACGSDKPKSVEDKALPVPVKVEKVNEKGSLSFLTASGKVEAVKSADISTRMMGYVDKIHVQVGEKVQKGQLLLSINNTDISAKLAQVNAGITEAQAAFDNAKKDYERFNALFNEHSATQKELDDMTTQYNMAKARLEAATEMKNEVNAQLSYANIRAPFKGVVTNKFINTGDMANPGTPLLEVESPGKYQVLAMVSESEILDIKIDAEVDVHLKSLNKKVKARVAEVSTSAKNTGGQYLVKVILQEANANILSGMYASVQFPMTENANLQAIRIPLEAIVRQGQLTGVYTVSQSNTALLRWLRLGRTYGDKVEVLSGLSADERLIIASEGKLYNGVKISIQ